MKKFLLFVIALMITSTVISQNISTYVFAASSGTFTALVGGTNPTNTGGTDLGYYNTIPIGFTFTYGGVGYTTCSASTDGVLLLGGVFSSGMTTNNLTSGTPRPLIAPLWDDLDIQAVTNFTYLLTGSAGSRIFTAEWLSAKWSYLASAGCMSFQVKLYEATNKVEFVYRQEAGTLSSPSASIGLSDVATGSGNFLSLDGTGINPNSSSTSETTTLSTKPATGQVYAFTPPAPGTPGAPINPSPATASVGVPVSGSLTWTFGANTLTYDLMFGPTGSMTQVVTGATAGATGTYTYSGLTNSAVYQWQVIEHNGGLFTNGPTWNFTTMCNGISSFPWTENFDAMATVGVGIFPSCWSATSPSGTPWYSGNAGSISYNDPCSSPNYLYVNYIPSSVDKFLYTPPFTLTAGTIYQFQFNWVGDTYAGWTGDVLVNTSASGTGATLLTPSFVLPATTTTAVCTLAKRSFVPSTTGTYYFMIRINNTGVPYDLGFDDFNVSVSPPCTTPPAQPTSLVLTPTATSIAGSFTAATGADKYLVVRSLNSTLSADPAYGIVYSPGSSLGGGTVEYYGAATTFTSTGLASATKYYYFIYSANDLLCSGFPTYLTTSPLTGNQTTLPIVPISGTKNVGPTGDFLTLTAAFQYLAENGVTGPVNLVLQSAYLSSAEPAFPIPALAIPGASVTNKVTVYPSVTGQIGRAHV